MPSAGDTSTGGGRAALAAGLAATGTLAAWLANSKHERTTTEVRLRRAHSRFESQQNRAPAEFFDLLGPSGCERIALVTVDLAASWQKALRALVPHAWVVFDRFHVERLASDAVDEVRRAEQRLVGAKAAKALKGTRFCLLKHPARLKPGEKRRLETLRRQNRAPIS